MKQPDIVIHPSLTMRKYTEVGHELPSGWKAETAFEGLRRRLPDTSIVLGTQEQFDSGVFADVRVLLTNIAKKELLDSMPKLEWLQFTGSGADHFFKASGIDPAGFRKLGVKVVNTPGVSRYPVSEHVLAMILALARGVPRAVRQQSRREWTIFPVSEVRGKTLGIIGLGEIGERVASLGRAFGMHVIGSKRDPNTHGGNAHMVVGSDRMDVIVKSADYLVLLTPLTDATRNMFNLGTFQKMKPTSYFINVSRGENVVEEDLVKALQQNVIAGAAIDTFGPISFDDAKKLEALRPDSALWDLPNMLVMPNNAAATDCYMDYFVDAVVDNYTRWRAGEPFRSVSA